MEITDTLNRFEDKFCTYQRYFSRVENNVDIDTIPMIKYFLSPFLNTMIVGMPRMPYSMAMPELLFVFSFKHLILPAYYFANSLINGTIMQ